MMYANVNANDSAKPKRYKPETGGILPQMADVVEWIATADNRATWTFETSTRTGLFAPVPPYPFTRCGLTRSQWRQLTPGTSCQLRR